MWAGGFERSDMLVAEVCSVDTLSKTGPMLNGDAVKLGCQVWRDLTGCAFHGQL